MIHRYIEFNTVKFSADTQYPFYSFLCNEGSTSFQTDIAINLDGAMFSNFRYNERVVPLKGHVIANSEEELTANVQTLFIKCNGKTKSTLKFFNGFKLYEAEAIASIPTLSEKRGLCYEFNINFTLPKFYWCESEKTIIPLFNRKNVVSDTFTLPCVFTSRTAGNAIENITDFEIFPMIEFVAISDGDYNLIIENKTNNTSIELLNYTLNKNDVITIDLEKVTATHNGEDIINCFNDFTDFCLISGKNEITVTNNDEILNASIMLKYNQKYVGI